eukprot:12414645-Karenia_brevis.AAC.1
MKAYKLYSGIALHEQILGIPPPNFGHLCEFWSHLSTWYWPEGIHLCMPPHCAHLLMTSVASAEAVRHGCYKLRGAPAGPC